MRARRSPGGRAPGRPADLVPSALLLLSALLLPSGALADHAEGAEDPRTGGPTATPPVEELQERLRARIEAGGLPARLSAGGELIHAARVLPAFYEDRGYVPAWVEPDGLSAAADSLLDVLERADRHGLDPADYHASRIRSLRASLGDRQETGRPTVRAAPPEGRDPGRAIVVDRLGQWVNLELLLTDAFMTYGAHLADGRVDPETLEPDWVPSRRNPDMHRILESALVEERVADALRALRPPHREYDLLVDAYSRYRGIAAFGGWPTVPEGGKLAPGDSTERVPFLRRRLAATGQLTEGAVGSPLVFDSTLAGAVRSFQRSHGLEGDGVVGPATLAALNTSAAERVRQIRLNLERWRWLPDDMGERHVRVNIADYELEVVEDGRTVLSMRAIVGRPYRKTPTFSDRISYLVFNPYWHVPHSLAVQDQLPLIKEDPDYLDRMGFQVFRGWGADARPVDPSTVDWQSLSAGNFPYRLRQAPGPQNALGEVKFMFPNRFSVYLHDTPAGDLFARRIRSFSSGCIRVQDAAALAKYLLRDHPGWSPEAVDRVMGAGTGEETVRLPEPVPVHIYYMTAWSEEVGTMEFRPDVYSRDQALDRALGEDPPDPAEQLRLPTGPVGTPGSGGGGQ